MSRNAGPGDVGELDSYLDAFESVFHKNGSAELDNFLPSPTHPQFLQILIELACIDLELQWERGSKRTAAYYFERYPALKSDPNAKLAVIQEELRQHRHSGAEVDPADLESHYGLAAGELTISSSETDTHPGDRWGDPSTTRSEVRATIGDRAELCAAVDALRRVGSANASSVDSWLDFHAPENVSISLLRDLHKAAPTSLEGFSQALSSLPKAGDDFLGFVIVRELGSGAFGSVYLAKQHSLADRYVALKISPDVLYESQMLAQLQHANVVPIYSLHRRGSQQAVCMPYLGSVTFMHLLRELREGPPPTDGSDIVEILDRCGVPNRVTDSSAASVTDDNRSTLANQSYTQAVVSLFLKIVDGLQHAHCRGILHQDLKPANILLSDEGQPMLLDFNLSQDSKLSDSAAKAMIGGTLPYMAPEVIRAFRDGRAAYEKRSDIYSVGVILFEMLTLQHPFPIRKGVLEQITAEMLADREGPPPNPRTSNPLVSPALGAIVARCLEPDLDKRYASADDLLCDLKLHSEDRPLKYAPNPSLVERVSKWRRRHPKLTSVSGVGAVALMVVLGLSLVLMSWNSRWASERALEQKRQFDQAVEGIRTRIYSTYTLEELDAGPELFQPVFDQFHVNRAGDWRTRSPYALLPPEQQQDVDRQLGELTMLLARVQCLQNLNNTTIRADAIHKAIETNRSAMRFFDKEPASLVLQQRLFEQLLASNRGLRGERFPLSDDLDPLDAWDGLLLASTYLLMREHERANAEAQRVRTKHPSLFWAWWISAICETRLGNTLEAKDCFDICIAQRPEFFGSYAGRAKCWMELRSPAKAIEDYNVMLQMDPRQGIYKLRAIAWMELGDYRQAVADLQTAMLDPQEERSSRLLLEQCYRKLGEVSAADEILEAIAVETDEQTAALLAAIDRLIHRGEFEAAFSRLEQARLSRDSLSLGLTLKLAELLSDHLGDHRRAVELMDELISIDPDPLLLAYQGIYLARDGRRDEAHRLANSLSAGQAASAGIVYRIGRIFALTSRTHPEDADRAFESLQRALALGFGGNRLADEPDLEPIRTLPKFQQLLDRGR